MTEKRPKAPRTDPHIPDDEISELGVGQEEEKAVNQTGDASAPEEDVLGFFEGNPGGCPCRSPVSYPDPHV